MDDFELGWPEDELFLEEEDLLEREALVPANDAEIDRLAARDSSSGALEDDDSECREGMMADRMLHRFREVVVELSPTY